MPGRPNRGFLVRQVLELDQTERKAVDEQHDIGPPLALALDDGELIDCQPVVAGGVVEVHREALRSAHSPASTPVLNRYTLYEHAVERAVARLPT